MAVVNVYTIAGANTWTKPGGSVYVHGSLIAGGGGGGSGSGAASGNRGGGGGGGGVGLSVFEQAASILGGTETATVGAGGGVQATNSTAGNNGTNSTFGI